ncbi:MAG: hypothetical protein MR419_11010, partial [Clostridiales bacterium]|nr:hypothetical protein [Clostridiales bacterium]MDY4172662.1 hypothetical protein [Evtepia sp.]
MNEPKLNAKSIMEMGGGSFLERIDYEMARVMNNILDANTKATAKRKVTVTLTFTPDDDRSIIGVDVVVKSALAPTNPAVTPPVPHGRGRHRGGPGGGDGPPDPRPDFPGRHGTGSAVHLENHPVCIR